MIHKLRRKFIAITTVSVTLVMVLVGLSINVVNFLSTNDALESTLELIYENQGTMPQSPGKPGDRHANRFTAETPFSTRYFVLRYTGAGDLTGADMRHIAAVTEDDAGTYLSIVQAHGEGFGFTGNYKFYVVKTGTDKYMAIFLDCYDELQTLRGFALVSLLVVACCILLVLVLVVLLSRRAIAPTLQAMEKQKQFITDASHELKTPLTVINTSLKVLEMESGQNRWTDKIQAQTDKLTRLVGDLVTLSRLDEEQPVLQKAEFSLSQAVEETALSFQDLAAARGRTLSMCIAPDLLYQGDEAALRQLTGILLDNAVKYAPAGSEIFLTLRREKKRSVLQTVNPCPSMDAEEPERLFDRFYRADKSRSGQTPGFGIGLSIARSIAEAHQGSISAALLEDGKIQFTVILP